MTKLHCNLVTVSVGEYMRRVNLKNITTIKLKKQLEENGLPTTGTKADKEMCLEHIIQETDGNPDKFFLTVKETQVNKRKCDMC